MPKQFIYPPETIPMGLAEFGRELQSLGRSLCESPHLVDPSRIRLMANFMEDAAEAVDVAKVAFDCCIKDCLSPQHPAFGPGATASPAPSD